jgi:hypothetical protein
MKFTYSSGQRPLEGYTLKRGVGHGGFGEVYYALSDGGKEVALKLVRGNLDVELRGVAQCLNLKHPNLVSLYDMKTDPQGDRWVIMEYVAGETLSVVLARHPNGLPAELAQQWFVALTQAVGYLHDHGIVHRDLKPGNIFLENGTLKVGDYGLSKFMSSSQRTAQTQSVGTVHYMAPEISSGNYNRQIDIYAAGIMLYEMLTGHVPFDGESAGEILMKHLTSPPDLSKVPPDYVGIVGKALSKNPAHRFATMAEMAKAVETVDGDVVPVAQPAPSVAASSATPKLKVQPQPSREPILTVLPAVTFRGQVAELCGSLALTPIFAALAILVLTAVGRITDIQQIGQAFFLTVLAAWAVLIPAKLWAGRRGDPWARRLSMMIVGLALGMSALWVDGWSVKRALVSHSLEQAESTRWFGIGPRSSELPVMAQYLSYFGLAFFAVRWWKMADRRRAHRFSFAPILAAGFWSLILLLLWNMVVGAIALVLASAIVQLVSPWDAPLPNPAKRLRLKYA